MGLDVILTGEDEEGEREKSKWGVKRLCSAGGSGALQRLPGV